MIENYTDLARDHAFLMQALRCAEKRSGFCSPNPSVGAVIVSSGGGVLAEGYHLGPGMPHAERMALRHLSARDIPASGTTMYVTLEPCSHFGRTPPCTEALIEAKVKRVVYGYRDPNPDVSGQGALVLKSHGITCDYVSIPEIDAFYESYRYWCENKRPRVTAKLAMSLDGKIAGPGGRPLQLTGDALKRVTHTHRRLSDALLTTINTVLQDDPQLNVRCDHEVIAKPIYLLDSSLRLPCHASILKTAQSLTVFHASSADPVKKDALLAQGIRCIEVVSGEHGLSLSTILQKIGQDGVHDLWVEAGGTCFAAFLNARLLHRAYIYVALRWIGEGLSAFSNDGISMDALQGKTLQCQTIGNDVLYEIHW